VKLIKLYQKQLIYVLILIGVFMRFYTAGFGSNFDFETWNIGPELIKKGISVYTIPDTDAWGRFNWGPIWPYTLYIFKLLAGDDRQTFHYLLTGYLTFIDLALCYLFYKFYGKTVALLYFLSPLTYLITGFHLQFENTALLLAFLGWYFYLKEDKKYYLISAVLFGLSITAKHILILFPVWLFFFEYFQKNKVNFLWNIYHKSIIYFIFFGGFLVEILIHFQKANEVIDGIIKYVFKYNSFDGLSAFSQLIRFIGNTDIYQFINLFVPLNLFISILPAGHSYYRLLFLLILAVLGFFVAKNIQQKTLLLPLYLLFFFSFGSSLADQYFVIPLVTSLIFYQRIESIIYHIVAGTYLATFSLNNIASISNVYYFKLGELSIPIFPYNLKQIFTIDPNTQRFDMNSYSNYYIPQFYLLLMSCLFIYRILKKESLEIAKDKLNIKIIYLYGLFYFYILFIIILRKYIIDTI
jgi:hypothetical protein